jgi:hypothetical protein
MNKINQIKKMFGENNLMDNWKRRFRERKVIENGMFRIGVRELSQRERPIPEDLKVC